MRKKTNDLTTNKIEHKKNKQIKKRIKIKTKKGKKSWHY